jgi:Raf kinase inhibitor-like YbhB/YbcL family protein
MSVLEQVSKLAGEVIRPLRAGADKLAGAKEVAPAGLPVASSSFHDGDAIAPRYAGEKGVAPEIRWGNVPRGAQELVVLCEDPDAPMPKPFVHWAVYGLPPSATSLPEGLGASATLEGGGQQGKNSTGHEGYTGPKPPRGHGVHHYHFQVFALDRPTGLGAGADRDALVAAMHEHVIASGEIVGTYETK